MHDREGIVLDHLEEESEDSRSIQQSTSTHEAGMKVSVPVVRGQALPHPSSGKKQE
jgi:hypothetical protein